MIDFESFYIIAVLVYLSECFASIPETSVLFFRPWGPWKVVRRFGIGIPQNKRLVFLQPLPWISDWYICSQPMGTPLADGCVGVNSLHTYSHLPTSIASATADSEVCRTAYALWQFGGISSDASSCKTKTFAEAIEQWIDPSSWNKAPTQYATLLWLLKICCSVQFVYIFLGAPVLFTFYGVLQIYIPFLCIMVGIGCLIGSLYFRLQLLLQPETKSAAIGKAFLFCVYPFSAIRAVATLTKDLSTARHEMIVALNIFTASELKRYIADVGVLLRWQGFSASLSTQTFAQLMCANYTLYKALVRLAKAKYPTAGITAVPWSKIGTLPASQQQYMALEKAVRYCPMCGLSFIQPLPYCSQCHEIRTIPVHSHES